MQPTLVDLFCGAGGKTLGFVQAGFKPIYAIDIDDYDGGRAAARNGGARARGRGRGRGRARRARDEDDDDWEG